MFYRVLSGDVFSILSFFSLLLCPSRYCEKIETINRTRLVSFYVTRGPIPWDKITVPNLLSPEMDTEISDYESFKTFVYVLFAITLVIGLYYCLKCFKCTKACGNAVCSESAVRQGSRLTSPIERTSRNRTARRMRRYQRINTPRLHASSRRSRTALPTTDVETSLIKLDKPPDYSTVILCDMQSKEVEYPEGRAETPPPSYDENIFKRPDFRHCWPE